MASNDKDRTLAAAVVRGDRDAAEALFDHVFDWLYRQVCARLGGDHHGGQDIVSETLHAGLAALRGYRAEASLTSWFLAIALRKIADRKRRRVAEVIAGNDGELETLLSVSRAPPPSPLENLADEETCGLIREALDSLPDRHRTVLQWKYFDESSVDAVAVRLQVTPKAAERRLARARAALASALRRRRVDVSPLA